jgi:hypothetical protein
MLIVFCGIQWIAHDCWLPKDNTFDSSFFCEEVFGPLAQKMQPKSERTHKPLTLIHMENASVRTARVTQEKWDVSLFKRMPQPRDGRILHHSPFFFRSAENPT